MPDATPDIQTRTAAYIDDALRLALHVLAGAMPSDQDIHDARKSLKKARGGLRLLRPALADEVFRANNLALRDAGRLLSPLRDSRSQLQLFHSIADDSGLPGAHIESALHADHSQARHEFDTTGARERCHELIAQARQAFGAKDKVDAPASAEGLRRIYRKARRAFAQARKKDSAARRHELRKQAKYLRVALDVIASSDYERARHHARRIASWLGEDHDLAVLRERIERLGADGERWFQRISERQEKLQHKAFAKAADLFTEKPKGFVSKLENDNGD